MQKMEHILWILFGRARIQASSNIYSTLKADYQKETSTETSEYGNLRNYNWTTLRGVRGCISCPNTGRALLRHSDVGTITAHQFTIVHPHSKD